MTTITLVVPDEFESCVETFLSSQVRNEAHPITGATIMKRIYPTAADWAEYVFRERLGEIARMYPTDAMQAKITQQQQLQQEIQDMSKPTSLKPSEVVEVAPSA